MPTTLPDAAARDRHERRRMLAELVPLAIAIFYLLLLVCSAAALATDVSVLFAPDQRPDGYNPMEPVGRAANAIPIRGLASR
jgi:hypothetical protein